MFLQICMASNQLGHRILSPILSFMAVRGNGGGRCRTGNAFLKNLEVLDLFYMNLAIQPKNEPKEL